MKGRQLPGKRHFLEIFLKKFWPVARAAGNNKFRPAGRRPTGRKKKRYAVDLHGIVPVSYTHLVCRLFEVSKRELQELCETYDVQPRRNEIGEYGFVSYDVRKLHNLAYHSSREDRREDPWA